MNNVSTRARTLILLAALTVGALGGIIFTTGTPEASAGQSVKVNASGDTYGTAWGSASPADEPDLIAAVATNGVVGYVRNSDLVGPMPRTPEEAVAMNDAPARTINVYESDGRTVIGKFVVGDGKE